MRLDFATFLTIIGMSLMAYACRGGGYWLFQRIKPSRELQVFLSYIPGALFISFIVPALVAGGPKEWIGGVVAAGTAYFTRSLTWPILTGTAAAWAAWWVNPGW